MECTNCGESLLIGSGFCGRCGAKATAATGLESLTFLDSLVSNHFRSQLKADLIGLAALSVIWGFINQLIPSGWFMTVVNIGGFVLALSIGVHMSTILSGFFKLPSFFAGFISVLITIFFISFIRGLIASFF